MIHSSEKTITVSSVQKKLNEIERERASIHSKINDLEECATKLAACESDLRVVLRIVGEFDLSAPTEAILESPPTSANSEGGDQKASARQKIIYASVQLLQKRQFIKPKLLFDLLKNDGIAVRGERNGNYISAILSARKDLFQPNRTHGWSLKSTSHS